MLKVALVVPSSQTGTCFVSARSWENNYFFLAGAAFGASWSFFLMGSAAAAILKASLRACSAPFVSPDTVRTSLLPGIFMRLYAGWVAAINWAKAGNPRIALYGRSILAMSKSMSLV